MKYSPQQQGDNGAHLSTFDRSRIACGDWQPDGVVAQHLRTCAQCAEQIAAETADVRAMAYVAVPEDLLAIARQQDAKKQSSDSPLVWRSIVAAGVLALASVVVVMTRPEAPTVRLKGAGGIAISVMRGGKLVVDNDAVEHPVTLQTGDQVQLHLLRPHVAWAVVRVGDDNREDPYFAGRPPADGWLPFSMAIDDAPHVNVRLWTCERAPTGSVDEAVAQGVCKLDAFGIGR